MKVLFFPLVRLHLAGLQNFLVGVLVAKHGIHGRPCSLLNTRCDGEHALSPPVPLPLLFSNPCRRCSALLLSQGRLS